MQDDPLPYGEWHIEQSPRWREYIRRDPAVLAALPEVQALVAAAVREALERAASKCDALGDAAWEEDRKVTSEAFWKAEEAIRALIPEVPQ
jgi:hypothetical protein